MQRTIVNKKDKIERYYREKSKLDDMRSPSYQQEVIEYFLKKYANNQTIKVLDYGTGIGSNINTLLKMGYASIYAVDISSRAIDISKKKYAKFKNVRFFLINDLILPFKDNEFDLVICTEVLEHVSDIKQIIKEIKRVTSKKGSILISTPNYFNPTGIIKFLSDLFSKEKDWNPWGAHKGGYERLINWHNLRAFFGNNLVIIEDQGRDMLLSWFYSIRHYLPSKIATYLLLLPKKISLLKFISMNYYIFFKKNED